MKSHLTAAVASIITALWFASGVAYSTELPVSVPLTKYQAMIDKSPFAVATPVVTTTATSTAPFAQDLYICGISKLGKSDFVTIASKDQSQRFSLMAGETNSDGISLVSVDLDPSAPGNRRVKLKKGAEQGDILFDEASFHPAPPPAQPQPRVGQPPTGRPGFPRIPPRIPPGSRVPPRQPNMPNQPPFQPGQQVRHRSTPISSGPS